MQGKIVKGIAGFYYVHVKEQGVYACKAKGIFRKDNTKPLVGDNVEITVLSAKEREGSITAILPRKSELVRPAVANVDQALVILAVAKPEPSLNLLDRFLITIKRQGLPCIVCFNKRDIGSEDKAEKLLSAYENCGCRVLFVSAKKKEGIGEIQSLLKGRTTAVAGPSGVGKSSLINCLQDTTVMETGAVSEKIDRGRHTTRHTELIPLGGDAYIMDTPGFSSLSLFDMKKEELAGCYPEFAAWESGCRFRGCAHMSEPVCGVRQAVEEGRISPVRYENYRLLYEELKKSSGKKG